MAKKTKEEFITELAKIKPNIEVIGDYISSQSKIKLKCKICNTEWETTPSHILSDNRNCPKCGKLKRAKAQMKTTENFKKELYEINKNIELLEEYKGANREIKVKCKVCNNEYYKTPYNLLTEMFGCPYCSKEYNRKRLIKHNKEELKEILTKEDNTFQSELYSINSNIIPMSKYKNNYTKIKCKCNICNNIWYATPNRLLSGTGCPKCANNGTSKGEQDLIDTLKETINSYIERGIRIKLYKETEENLKNKYILEERKYFSNNGKRYQLDIYFPNLKLGIEYDGNYWHSDDMKDKHYQVEKREFFKELGIKVIFIREDEWDFKREKMLYRIMSILGLYKMKTYARKLYVDLEVPNFEANKLMELSHIQGKDNSSIKIGLRNKHETLVAVMTFGKPRYITKTKDDEETTYELIRYCTYPESVIIGGFSKLLKAGEEYLKTLGVTRIKTFADRRFSSDDDNVYLKNGFNINNISGANYVYVKGYEVLKRYECQKHKLHKILGDNFDESLSETVNMANNGYLRIYDSGNLVYYKNIE